MGDVVEHQWNEMLSYILVFQAFESPFDPNIVQSLIFTFYSKTGIYLDIYEGQVTAILGHSGAGKSTLLNILSGLSVSTEGEKISLQSKLADKTGSQSDYIKVKRFFKAGFLYNWAI